MEEVIAVLLVGWLGVSSIITGYVIISDNVTSKENVIYLCDKVGQFQYETTIVECNIKGKGN